MDNAVKKFSDFLYECMLLSTLNMNGELDRVRKELNVPYLELSDLNNISKTMDKEQVEISIVFLGVSKNIYDLLNLNLKEYKEENVIFGDFDVVSRLLSLSSLNTREQLNVILFFIRRNLDTGILNEEKLVYRPKDIYEDGNKKILLNKSDKNLLSKYNEILNKDDDILTEKEKIEKEKMKENLEGKYINIDDIMEAHLFIKESYLDKTSTFNYDDVKQIEEAFRILSIQEKTISKISYFLNNQVQKREKQEQMKINLNQNEQYKTLNNNYSSIRKELQEYYDFDHMILKRMLSMDEIIYCVSLLRKINTKEEIIRDFVVMANQEINNHNSVTRYIQLREKLEIYAEKYGLLKEMDELDQYFKEIFLCDDIDYSFYKSCIDENLKNILKLIPNTYEYELKK